MVLDTSRARNVWHWAPARTTDEILEEILDHARQHPDWLTVSGQA
jgi:CDP-paratose 2-epimerase